MNYGIGRGYKTFELFMKGYVISSSHPFFLISPHLTPHSFTPSNLPYLVSNMSEELRKLAHLDPATAQLALEAYMGADRGWFLGGYVAG